MAALASVRLKGGQKEYLCKWMPCARLSWVPLTEIISLDDDCMQMWEEFEASCHKVDVTIRKAAGASYGIELSGNCVVGMHAGCAAEEGGELQVRDVVVGLDGDVLHDTTLAMSLATHPSDTIMLSVVRPGSMVKLSPLAVPQLAPCASSGRAWRLWAARHSQSEAQPLVPQPPPRVLEL